MPNFMDAYRAYGDDFEFCRIMSKKVCPLRDKCLRAVDPPNSSPYWCHNGKYNKKTKQCEIFIPIENPEK